MVEALKSAAFHVLGIIAFAVVVTVLAVVLLGCEQVLSVAEPDRFNVGVGHEFRETGHNFDRTWSMDNGDATFVYAEFGYDFGAQKRHAEKLVLERDLVSSLETAFDKKTSEVDELRAEVADLRTQLAATNAVAAHAVEHIDAEKTTASAASDQAGAGLPMWLQIAIGSGLLSAGYGARALRSGERAATPAE